MQTRIPCPNYVDRLARDLDRMEQAGDWYRLVVTILPYMRWPIMLMLTLAEWDRLKRIRRRRMRHQNPMAEQERVVRRRIDEPARG